MEEACQACQELLTERLHVRKRGKKTKKWLCQRSNFEIEMLTWCAETAGGAIHAKSTNVGRGHLTDLIKNWHVGWDG